MPTDRIPKNGWLVFSRVTGEHQVVPPNLDSLLIAWTGMRDRAMIAWTGMLDRARKLGSDKAELVLCYELGSQMQVSISSSIGDLVPLADGPVQADSRSGKERTE